MSVSAPNRDPELPGRRRSGDPAPSSNGREPVLSGRMPREEIIAHLIFQLNEHRRSPEARRGGARSAECSSCGDRYPAWHNRLLGGKCLDCYLELTVGCLPDEPGWTLSTALRGIFYRVTRSDGPPPAEGDDDSGD